MRVKVTKTIDFEQVPGFILEIISECNELLHASANDLPKTIYDIQIFLEKCKQVQENLIVINDKIDDSINIFSGWQQALNAPPAEQASEQYEPEEQHLEDN